ADVGQVYLVETPRGKTRRLVAFARVDLKPGETRRIDVPINPRLLAEIDRAGPFGAGCPEPVFVLPAHRLTEVVEVGAGGHLRIKLRAGDGATIGGIAFRAAREPLGQALLAARGESVHLAGTLTLNRWGGSERAELRVVDLARPL
ncbi:fibronectin type III-like domain-contianing protein, partial [Bosea sp. (in: a-proteobacteria)]|uniref:fibronectin type III-like domain-contianing protein n=1 Tax=Bosea sp. (in: a-proteobacteria) TaxID=1871050 RepID=UPI0025B7B584